MCDVSVSSLGETFGRLISSQTQAMVLLKELSLMHKGDLSNTADDHEVDEKAANEIEKLVSKTGEEIKTIREGLMLTARLLLSPRQLTFVEAAHGPGAVVDPSIQFFGLDWSAVLPRWAAFRKRLRLYWYGVDQLRADPSVLVGLLCSLEQLLGELHLHCLASRGTMVPVMVIVGGSEDDLEDTIEDETRPKGLYNTFRRKSAQLNQHLSCGLQKLLPRRHSDQGCRPNMPAQDQVERRKSFQ